MSREKALPIPGGVINLPDIDRPGSFRFPSTNTAANPWDVRGAYQLRAGEVQIVEVALVPNPHAGDLTVGLDPERIRRLTRTAPIKRAIIEYLRAHRAEILEANDALTAAGKPSRLVGYWADQLTADAGALTRPRTRKKAEEWATWARDYLGEVHSRGTAWGVHPALVDAWSVDIETVRYRVKRMRRLGWIQGEGHLVQPGPLLVQHEANSAERNRRRPGPTRSRQD